MEDEEQFVCKCTPIEACDECHRNRLHYGEEE
jgi:hypothetical protein